MQIFDNVIFFTDNLDDNNWESVFRVFPLPDMFFHLKNRCMAVTNPQTIAFPNDVLARAELQKDTYHFELDSACKVESSINYIYTFVYHKNFLYHSFLKYSFPVKVQKLINF